MKNLFLILILAAGMHAISAKAGLGWTLAECQEHYKTEGTPVAKNDNDLGLEGYEFTAQDYSIRVAFDNGKVISISYVKANFNDAIEKILSQNAPNATWSKSTTDASTDHNLYWSGRENGVETYFAILTPFTVLGTTVYKLQVSTERINQLIDQQRKTSDL